jgi:CRISPR type I-E-associated protein CasB/Cse2
MSEIILTEPLTKTKTPFYENFETILRKLIESPGPRADLKSGRNLEPVTATRMHRHVAKFVSDKKLDSGLEIAVYGVASLAATHPKAKESTKSLGLAFGELAKRDDRIEAIEKRLLFLCRATTTASLLKNLWSPISLLESGGIGISWGLLARDLTEWEYNRDRITRQWLRDFFFTTSSADELENADDNNPESPSTTN